MNLKLGIQGEVMVSLLALPPSIYVFDLSVCLICFYKGTFWTSPQVCGELVWPDPGCQDHQSQEPEREGTVMTFQ